MKADLTTLRVKVPMIAGCAGVPKPIFVFKYCLPTGSDWHCYLRLLPKDEADEKHFRLGELIHAEALTF